MNKNIKQDIVKAMVDAFLIKLKVLEKIHYTKMSDEDKHRAFLYFIEGTEYYQNTKEAKK